MGGGSSQSSSGSSSGTNEFQSNPQNMQEQGFRNLANPISNAIGSIFQNPDASSFFGTGYNQVAPTSVYNRDIGANVGTNNTAFNPLVAPMTPQQQDLVTAVGSRYPFGPQQVNAENSNATLAGVAQSNPWLQNGANAGLGTTDFGQNASNFGANPINAAYGVGANPGNFGGGTAGQAAQYGGNGGNFGGGAAGAAGNVAGSILPNAYPALAAATGTALGGGYGGGGANAALNTAENSGFGTGLARQAGQYASDSGFGTGLAGQAGQFAAQGQNLAPAGQVYRREMDPNFAANLATGGPTQSVIQAAINPIINAFNSQTIPGLQGVFTAAGQRVNSAGTGVGGSSAFDMAGANAVTGLEGQIGSTAAGIINPTYQQGIGISAAAPGQFAALKAQKLAGMESAAQTKLQTQTGKEQALQGAAQTKSQVTAQQIQSLDQASLARLQVTTGKTANELSAAAAAGTLTAQESAALTAASGAQTGAGAAQAGALQGAAGQQTAAGAAQAGALNQTGQAATGVGTAQTNAMTAGGALSSQVGAERTAGLATSAQSSMALNSSLMNNLINSLNASALPQLTQQYGINQGLSLYNTQVQQLLTTLGLGAQASQPAIGNIASGFGQSSGSNRSSGKGMSLA